MNIFLYISIVLIWGSTWIAIYFQLGDVPVLVSIFYRFALASVILMPFMILSGKLQKPLLKDHGFIALQGACLFSVNFICFYYATSYISSGLVAITFSFASIYNALNNRLFYREPIANTTLLASLFGIIGLAMVFYSELQRVDFDGDVIKGIALSALGTLFFSFANIISKRNSNKGLKPQTTIAYGMIYGCVLIVIIIAITGQTWVMPSKSVYIGSLLYLSTIGTVLAFILYLTLIARIGPARAAYTTVLFPIVALGFSSLFEGYQWSFISVIGLLLVILGNVIINLSSSKQASKHQI